MAFLAVQLAVFGLYMGSSFAPNHIGMPLVSPRLKLDFLRRQVLMSRNITGGPLDLDLHGRSQLPDRTPPVPLDGPASSPQGPTVGGGLLRRRRTSPTPKPACGSPTGPSSATSTLSDSKARTRSSARSSPNAEPSEPFARLPRRGVDQLLTGAVAAIAGAMNALSEFWKYSMVRRSPSRS